MKHLNLLSRSLEAAVLLAAVISTGAFLWVIVSSMQYPLGFSHVQYHILEHVQRILDGLPLYTEPSLEFIPGLYTPFYHYMIALFSLLFGLDLFTGKLVTLLAVLGTGAIIYAWLRKEKVGVPWALVGAAIYFATYNIYSLRNFMVRVDGMFCFLLILGGYLLYCRSGMISAIGAGVVFCLAFLTKQSALIAIFPIVFIYCFYQRTPRNYWAAGVFLGGLFLIIIILNSLSDGWFWYFVFWLPGQHSFNHRQWLGFWVTMIEYTWPAIILTLAGLWLIRARQKAILYAAFFSALFLCAYSMRLHSEGGPNSFMPACLGLALGAPMVFSTVHSAKLRIVFFLLLGAQFLLLHYDPTRYVASAQDIAKGKKYLESLGNLEGDVLIEGGGYFPTRQGKNIYSLYHTSLWDIERAGDMQLAKKVHDEFKAAIAQQKFSAIVTYYANPEKHYKAFKTSYNIDQYYRFKEKIDSNLSREELAAMGERNARPRFTAYSQSRFVFVPK